MSIAHRHLFDAVRNAPNREVQGHGSMSYTPNGYGTGYLPKNLAAIFYGLRSHGPVPTIYSYGTPIAWFDRKHSVWIVPAVSYSVTTGRQQSYIDGISVPRDLTLWSEYERYASRQMIFDRWAKTTRPGPNFVLS